MTAAQAYVLQMALEGQIENAQEEHPRWSLEKARRSAISVLTQILQEEGLAGAVEAGYILLEDQDQNPVDLGGISIETMLDFFNATR